MSTGMKWVVALALNVTVLLLAIPFGGPVTIPAILVCGFFAIVSVAAIVRRTA